MVDLFEFFTLDIPPSPVLATGRAPTAVVFVGNDWANSAKPSYRSLWIPPPIHLCFKDGLGEEVSLLHRE